MKKITRIIALLLLAAIASTSFVACGKDKKVEDGKPYENGEETDGSDGDHTKLY